MNFRYPFQRIEACPSMLSFDKLQFRVIACGKWSSKQITQIQDHNLPYYRMVYVLAGACSFLNKAGTIHAQKGDSLLLTPHASYVPVDVHKQATFYYVYFELQPANRHKEFNVAFEDAPIFACNGCEIGNLVEHISFEVQQAQYGYQSICNSLLRIILLRLLRSRKEITKRPNQQVRYSSKEELVHHAIYYIEQNIHGVLKVTDIASAIGITPNYLYKLFVQEYQISIQEYILQEKIKRSLQLLENPEFNIKEIANELSFSSQNHFSNTFKRYMNISPTNFRKKQWNNTNLS
ncbi:MAG: helix-turn-helix transcriptional regulator [Erysipelotrichaceae bacterium]